MKRDCRSRSTVGGWLHWKNELVHGCAKGINECLTRAWIVGRIEGVPSERMRGLNGFHWGGVKSWKGSPWGPWGLVMFDGHTKEFIGG